MQDDFYIGYLPAAPETYARRCRWVAIGLVLFALGLGGLLAALQSDVDPGIFEYQQPRTFRGQVESSPYPTMLVQRPGRAADGATPRSRYHLVAFGKHGVELGELEGRQVELEGSLIYRADRTMVEVVDGSLRPLGAGGDGAKRDTTELGSHTLRGEIVDAKCFLGTMKPGRSKPHRSCAVRCISGGIPPMLFVETARGEALTLLLVGAEGQALNERLLDLVGEPVEVSGTVSRRGELLVLAADADAYQRLPSRHP